MKKLLKAIFTSNGKIHAPYIYIFLLFFFLSLILGVRITCVFTYFYGESLSDTLVISLATQIIALVVSDAWHKRNKNGNHNGGVDEEN